MRRSTIASSIGAAVLGGALALSANPANAAWKPTRTVEFIVPAGIGGGAGQMAQLIQGIIQKHKLMPVSMVVISKKAGSGAQGFLYVKNHKGDPDKLIITLSNLFTTPLATGSPFSWKDFTPIAMMALDEFVFWVNSKTPYKTPQEYLAAVKKAPMKFKMGGTGSKQEDQIVTAEIEQQTGVKFNYVAYHGGGTVAEQPVRGHVHTTGKKTNQQGGELGGGQRGPLCVFDSVRMPYKEKVTKDMSWNDIPTCKSTGLNVEYTMLRGIMTSPGVSQDVVDYYVDLMKKVRATPEWKAFMQTGAFNQSFMTGKKFHDWLAKTAAFHHDLMAKAGFLHK